VSSDGTFLFLRQLQVEDRASKEVLTP
jgi:hypothetical protein